MIIGRTPAGYMVATGRLFDVPDPNELCSALHAETMVFSMFDTFCSCMGRILRQSFPQMDGAL